jgi:hypothetical protein
MEETVAEGKYGKYILRNATKIPVLKQRPHTPSFSAREEYWPGVTGMGCNFSLNCVTEPRLLPDPPHKHEFDEYLLFMGGNPLNLQEFDAEIEVALGEEWERHTIDTTSILYIPKGLQHCPINIKRVGRPFIFGHIMLAGKYTTDRGGDLYTHDEDKAKREGPENPS